MAGKVKKLSFQEKVSLIGLPKGLWITFKHFALNLKGHAWRLLGRSTDFPSFTVRYPEETFPRGPRLRARHRLTKREDGSPKCVACFMCSTACPTECIYIEGEEHEDPRIEKQPRVFEIDLLRCCFCGLCVEACPEDAIRMDTGNVALAGSSRRDFILTMPELLAAERDPALPEA